MHMQPEDINHISAFQQSSKSSTNAFPDGPEHKAGAVLIADAGQSLDIKLRLFLKNKGYSVFESSNTIESIYFLKTKAIRYIIADESVLERNKKFFRSIDSAVEKNHTIKIILHSENGHTGYSPETKDVFSLKKQKPAEKVYQAIEKILNQTNV